MPRDKVLQRQVRECIEAIDKEQRQVLGWKQKDWKRQQLLAWEPFTADPGKCCNLDLRDCCLTLMVKASIWTHP